MRHLSFSNAPLHFSSSPLDGPPPPACMDISLSVRITECWAHFSSHSCPPSSSKMNSHILFLPPPTSTLILKTKNKKLPYRNEMLTLLFLGTSTSDNVLEVTSPPKAAGSGARLHTGIPVGRSACALRPLWNAA